MACSSSSSASSLLRGCLRSRGAAWSAAAGRHHGPAAVTATLASSACSPVSMAGAQRSGGLAVGGVWTQSVRTKMYYGNESTEVTPFRRWLFNAAGFNQYGLYFHDCLHESDDVKEAVRRLPPQAQDERAFRIQRALHLSMRKVVLPREEWPTLEEDIQKGRYLKDLLKEIEAENEEKRQWESKV